jgi:hypothetical protein
MSAPSSQITYPEASLRRSPAFNENAVREISGSRVSAISPSMLLPKAALSVSLEGSPAISASMV